VSTPITDAAYDAVRSFTNEEQAVDALMEMRETSRKLERENAALREDKERLDWLGSLKDQPWLCWETPLRLNRQTLDAVRKEAQP